jgi:predicted nucleic acid-binding protein
MSLYIDTSCLLKLFFVEPESERVRELVTREPQVIISTLARLEAAQCLLAARLAGDVSRTQHGRLTARIAEMLQTPPFEVAEFPSAAVAASERQSARGVYSRTLDRLHLGAMEELGLRRLLTNDDQQAAAARALGFEVLMPR